jgi:hypothetical protein
MTLSRILIAIILATPLFANAGQEGKVQIITSFSKPSQCISPMHIRKIDGREVAVQRMGFWIEPGVHTMTGSALIDASSCPTVGRTTNPPRAEPLEAHFDLGKVYYVGYDHSSRNKDEWKIVVWKVEDAKTN